MITTNFYGLILKYLLVLIGMITPGIMLYWLGPKPSISEYFESPAQFLFLLVNAGTSFYFVTTNKWLLPGIFLLLLSCFSIKYYPQIHNITAILFFISSVISILRSNRYKSIGYIILCITPILYFSLFWYEYISIILICIFHGLILQDIAKLQRFVF